MQEAQLFITASSLAYTTLMSLIPVLAVSFSVFKAFGGLEHLYGVIEPWVIENLTEGTDEQVLTIIRGMIGNIHAGALGIGGFIGLILTSTSLFWNIENAIQRVWKAKPRQGWFRRFAVYWLLITLGPLGISIALGLAGMGQMSGTPSNSDATTVRFIPYGGVIFFFTAALLVLIYKYVPNRKVNWRPAIAGGLVTGVVWNLARAGYGFYIGNLVHYRNIYGSIAALPILLLWLYIIWLILLSGTALTAAFQKRRD